MRSNCMRMHGGDIVSYCNLRHTAKNNNNRIVKHGAYSGMVGDVVNLYDLIPLKCEQSTAIFYTQFPRNFSVGCGFICFRMHTIEYTMF